MATISPDIRTVTLPAAMATKIVSRGESMLALVNIGTALASMDTTNAVVAGVGFPLAAAATAGDQGGGIAFSENTRIDTDLWAISTAGTVICVFGA